MDLFATNNTTICCSVFYYIWGLIFIFLKNQTFIFMWAQQMAAFDECRLVKVQITIEWSFT